MADELDTDAIDDIQIPIDPDRVMRIGVEVSLTLRSDRSSAGQAILASALEHFLELFGNRIAFVHTEESGKWKKTSSEEVMALPQFLRDAEPMRGVGLHLNGGERPQDAHPVRFAVYSSASWEPEPIAYLSAGASLADWQALGENAFRDWVRDLCNILRPIQGAAGLSLLLNGQWASDSDIRPQVIAILDRFPGLHIDTGVSGAMAVREGVISPNWLTILSNSLLARLGGIDELEEPLSGAGGELLRYDDGAILLAGTMPQLGDTDAGLFPESYRRIATLIHGVRGEPKNSLFAGGPPGTDVFAFSRRWVARFDTM